MEQRVNLDVEILDKQAEQFAQEIGIPPCPAVLTKLLRETRTDEPDFRRIGQLIANDVALAASVINTANSPFYGLRIKATTIQQALTLLGLHTVSQLVTGLLLRQAFTMTAAGGMERFWKSSMATALIAALIAREVGQVDAGGAHTYGLFRDCGMAVMLQKFPDYIDILNGSALANGGPVLEIEDQRFSMNHCRIGAQLARNWQLADSHCLAILHHHTLFDPANPDVEIMQESKLLVAIGLVAEHLYCSATGQAFPEWEDCWEGVLSQLGFNPGRLEELAERVKTAMRSI